MKAFQYDASDRNKTRLFQLDLNGDNEPLSGKLISGLAYQTADFVGYFKAFAEDYNVVLEKLSGSSTYEALSWVWGPPSNEQPLHLSAVSAKLTEAREIDHESESYRNGYIYIRQSLQEFLKRCRRNGRRQFLWIDAICIDQSSELDKSLHITGLRKVYEYSDAILYWVGTGSDNVKTVCSRLAAVTQALERCGQGDVELWRAPSWEVFGLPPPQDQFWIGARELMTNEWWSRLWTLQEGVFKVAEGGEGESFRKVLWGAESMEWSKIEAFATAVNMCRMDEWLIAGDWFVEVDDRCGFDALEEFRSCKEDYVFGSRLNASLHGTMRRRATNAVDMVIGQTALLGKGEAQKLSLHTLPSIEAIFIRFAKYYLRQEPFECLLNHTATKQRSAALPSWCPNFASHEETLSIGSFWFQDYTPNDPTTDDQFYHAGYNNNLWSRYTVPHSQTVGMIFKMTTNLARNRSAYADLYTSNNKRQMKVVENTNLLLLSGMEVDAVTHIVERNPAADSADFLSVASMRATLDWIAACRSLAMQTASRSQHFPEGSGFDAFVRTITANRNVVRPRRSKAQIFDYKGEADFLARHASFLSLAQDAIKSGKPVDRSRMDPDVLDHVHVLRCVTRRRRFFATADGRIGLGPSDMQPGDRLCVVFFCPTPYLLRETGQGRFRFMGESYVHGLMYGEAIELFRSGKLNETNWTVE